MVYTMAACPVQCYHSMPRGLRSVGQGQVTSSSTEGPSQPMMELRPDVPERTSSLHRTQRTSSHHVAVKGKGSNRSRGESHRHLLSRQHKPLECRDNRARGASRGKSWILAKLRPGSKRDMTWYPVFGALFSLPTLSIYSG